MVVKAHAFCCAMGGGEATASPDASRVSFALLRAAREKYVRVNKAQRKRFDPIARAMRRDSAEEREGPHVRADPSRQGAA
jgi:hypothetical protein